MRRKPGVLLPIEVDILDAGLELRRFHGFQLAKAIAGHPGPRALTAHGTLYKALQRLEDAGLLASRWEDPDVPGDRRRRARARRLAGPAGPDAATTSAGADVNPADRASELVSRWVAAYTRRLPAEVAERRRAEVASDVWEQRAAGRAAAAPAAVVAPSILRRMVAGMAADLRWRRGQLAAARTGRPPQPRARPVASALARSRWLVIAGAGLLVLLGIAWRRRSPVTGNAYRLLAAGQEPAAFVPGLVLLGLVLVYAGLRWRRRAT